MVIEKIRRSGDIGTIKVTFSCSLKEPLEAVVAPIDSSQGRDSREGIIENDMELWRDMLGPWIEDKGNQAGMLWGETYKNALPSPTVPFQNLLAIL